MFTRKMKLADAVQTNLNTLNVVARFDIKLGFGDKSVEGVCDEYDVNADFFLEILNAYNDPNYFPQKHLQSFSVTEIVEYLRKTHRSYIDDEIPYIENRLNQMLDGCSNAKEIGLVHNLFTEYKQELFRHLTWEDEKIFPYAVSIEKAFVGGQVPPSIKQAILTYPMANFLEDHDDIESKLYDINTLFIKYLPPVNKQQLCLKILKDLSLLESDLNNHSRIEEKVLAPKVIEMEKQLLARI